MREAGLVARPPFNRLGFRLTVLLTVVLLPLGVIAILQTLRTVEESRRRSELALLGEVMRAASIERSFVENALGAAHALGRAAIPLIDDPANCSRMLADYVASVPQVVFAGFTEPDGWLRCVSEGGPTNVSDHPQFRRLIETPERIVASTERGTVTGQSVIYVSQPIRSGGDLRGFLSISMPHAWFEDRLGDGRPLDMVTFNLDGEVLTASEGLENAEQGLPAGRDLRAMVARGSEAFTGASRTGEQRVFAMVPIVPGEVFAIGSWLPRDRMLRSSALTASVIAFPALMWVASLFVAFYGMDRMVIRHLQRMRSAMRRFAIGNRVLEPLELEEAAQEIREIGETFERMRLLVVRDEAELEDRVYERNVLLKEVHHRVKNNLQLITSIINMQVRNAASDEARAVLRRVQQRVMSLATVHRGLYQSPTLSEVATDRLIHDILDQLHSMSAVPGQNIAVSTELDPVRLYPDQALPLSLVVSEAVTNAFKYIGAPADGARPWLRLRLVQEPGNTVLLEVANSRGTPLDRGPTAGSGLGSELIAAFALQLGGELDRDERDDSYVLRLRFTAKAFEAEDHSERGAAET